MSDYSEWTPVGPGEYTITLWELWDTDCKEPYLVRVDSTPYDFGLEPGLLILKREYVPAGHAEFVNESRV